LRLQQFLPKKLKLALKKVLEKNIFSFKYCVGRYVGLTVDFSSKGALSSAFSVNKFKKEVTTIMKFRKNIDGIKNCQH
jgi:hypothetical protein